MRDLVSVHVVAELPARSLLRRTEKPGVSVVGLRGPSHVQGGVPMWLLVLGARRWRLLVHKGAVRRFHQAADRPQWCSAVLVVAVVAVKIHDL